MHRLSLRSLLAALVVLLMVLAACAEDDADEVAEEEEDEDLALDLDDDDDDDEAVEEDEPADEDEEEPAEEETDIAAAVAQYTSTIPEGWMYIGEADDFAQAIDVDGAVVVDVREEGEYEEGHIPGAINIPIRELGDNLNLMPVDQPLFVYCQAGWRGSIAVSSLHMMGYDNAEAFRHGPPEWEEAGYELVTDFPEPEDFGDPELPEPELTEATSQWLTTIPEGFLSIGDADAVAEAIDAGAAIVDVRDAETFEEEHVVDAINIDLRELGDRVDEVPTDVDVVVHCQSGWRCGLAMPVLGVHGYTNMTGFPGHFDALVEAGLTS